MYTNLKKSGCFGLKVFEVRLGNMHDVNLESSQNISIYLLQTDGLCADGYILL